MPPNDLQSAIVYIGGRYVFTAKDYPLLSLALTPEQQLSFIVSHSAHHINKIAGKISAECESADHGGALELPRLKQLTVKALINVLKLAQELGMSAEDLISRVPEEI